MLILKGVELVKQNEAQLFLRFGYFAILLGIIKPDINNQKSKVEAWKNAVRKYVVIPNDFAKPSSLIERPFQISEINPKSIKVNEETETKLKWTPVAVSESVIEIYRFFKNNKWDEAMVVLETEIFISDERLKDYIPSGLMEDLKNNYS